MTLSHTDFTAQTGAIPITFTRTYNSNFHLWTEFDAHFGTRLGLGWRHNYQIRLIVGETGTPIGSNTKYRVLMGAKTLSFSMVGGVFVPDSDAAGFKLEFFPQSYVMCGGTSYYILTAPDGTKFSFGFSGGQVSCMLATNENRIRFVYSGGIPNRLMALQPYFKDNTPTQKQVSFSYANISGIWSISRITLTRHGWFQPPSCSSDAGCATGEVCARNYHGVAPPPWGSSWGNAGDSAGCGKPLAEYAYTGGYEAWDSKIDYMLGFSLDDPNNAGALPVHYNTLGVLVTSTVLLSKASRNFEEPTKDFLSYTYETGDLPPPIVFKHAVRRLLSVADASGAILEAHTYDSLKRAITSTAGDGNLTFSYQSNQTVVTGANGQSQTVTFGAANQVTQKSGTCDCSTAVESRGWLEKDGHILPKYIKEQGTGSYTTFKYEWSGTRLVWKTVTYGDDDDDPDNNQSLPASATQITTHFHPTYHGVTTAVVSKSVESDKNLEVIYDYDPPTATTRCVAPATCTLAQFNTSDSKVLYRKIVRGYTRTISGGSSWQQSVRITEYTYDSMGRLATTIGPLANQQTTFTYYLSTDTIPNNRNQLYQTKVQVYDPRTSITKELITTFSEYNELGLPAKVTDPNGVTNVVVYDSVGRIKERHTDVRKLPGDSPLWAKWIYTRDAAGRIIKTEHPMGGILHNSYDGYGRLKKTSVQENASASIKDVKEFFYDASGRVTEIRQPQIKSNSSTYLKTLFEYDFVTQVGHPQRYGKITTTRTPLPTQGTHVVTRNANGTIAEVEDQNGQKTQYAYDPYRSLLTQITQYQVSGNSQPITVDYSYTPEGRVATITDPKGVTTSYIYDDFGNIVELTSPDRAPSGTPIRYEYDNNNNVTKMMRPDGSVVTYTYDTIGRLLKVDYSDPPFGANPALTDNDVEYFYGEVGDFTQGRLTRVTVKMLKVAAVDLERTTQFIYDAAGRIVERIITDTGESAYSTKFSYDLEGRQTDITYPHATWLSFRYGYHTLGQLRDVVQVLDPNTVNYRLRLGYLDSSGNTGPGGILNTIIHDSTTNASTPSSTSQITRLLNNGVKFGVSDPNSTPTSYMAGGPALDSQLQGHAGLIYQELLYNKTGIIDAIQCAGGNCSPCNQEKQYKYDGLYRLVEGGALTNNLPRYTYTYDANGNRVDSTDRATGASASINYRNSSNRLDTLVHSGGPSSTYSHNADGSRKEDAHWIYTYHTNGRLAVMTPKSGNSGKVVVFGYDHMGRRVRKMTFAPTPENAPISMTLYHFDLGGGLLEEYEIPDTSLPEVHHRYWLWAGGRIVGGGYMYWGNNSETVAQDYNFHNDHLGRPTAVTDIDGLPVWRSKAQPFGKDLGYALKDNPYTEVDLTQPGFSPIERVNYSPNEANQQIKAIIPAGVFGVQFYFENLALETTYDFFNVYTRSTSGDELLHSFTGNHQTGAWGNSATASFWGPVIPFRPKTVGSSPGELKFELLSDGSIQWAGYKVLKYRLWYVPQGDKFRQVQSDTPDSGNGVYADNLGTGTAPWSRTYTKDGVKLIRVCFDNFDVEYRYDWVEIRDANESIIQVLTGTLGNICSSWVAGPTVKVYLFSDSSVGRIGFSSATLEWMKSPDIRARLPGQWYEKDTEARDGTGLLLYAGLHYNWHRYYDSEVGRYISADPMGLKAGMNPYLYVSANPINAVDFYGLWEEAVSTFVAGAGDFASFGISAWIRKKTGWGSGMVNHCSWWYTAGQVAGFLAPFAGIIGKMIRARYMLRGEVALVEGVPGLFQKGQIPFEMNPFLATAGDTLANGAITLRGASTKAAASSAESIATLTHETIHRLLTPGMGTATGWFAGVRASIGQGAYQHSQLLRAIEEGAAFGFEVGSQSGLYRGIEAFFRAPFKSYNGKFYATLPRVLTELGGRLGFQWFVNGRALE